MFLDITSTHLPENAEAETVAAALLVRVVGIVIVVVGSNIWLGIVVRVAAVVVGLEEDLEVVVVDAITVENQGILLENVVTEF